MDIVDRLSFDATRCEMQFSKGVAKNIEEAADEIKRLRAALQGLVNDVLEYESKNNLHPNPGKKRCWQSVEYAENLLDN